MTEFLNRFLSEAVWAAEGTDAGTADAGTDAAADTAVAAAAATDEGVSQDGKTDGKAASTIAAVKEGDGADDKAEPDKPYYPEDWRETYAAKAAGGDEKAEKRILKKMKRYVDPQAVFSKAWELDAKFSEGGLVKIPGKNTSEDDIAEFHKAMGVPENSEDYFKDIQLDNGGVIGDADKPIINMFAEQAHKDGMTPQAFQGQMNAYYAQLEEQAAVLDESDNTFQIESTQELKEEYGSAYNRKTNSVSTLFVDAPGGLDLEAPNSLYARIMGGRMADGRVIGNDPDFIRWAVSRAHDINPIATVVDGGDQSGTSVEAEMATIMKFRRENKRDYFKDEKMQARWRELDEALTKNQERKRA